MCFVLMISHGLTTSLLHHTSTLRRTMTSDDPLYPYPPRLIVARRRRLNERRRLPTIDLARNSYHAPRWDADFSALAHGSGHLPFSTLELCRLQAPVVCNTVIANLFALSVSDLLLRSTSPTFKKGLTEGAKD